MRRLIYSDILKQSTESERAKLLKDYRAKILKSPLRDTIFMFTPFDDFNESQEHIKGLLERIEAITEDIMEKYHVQGRIYEYFLGFVTQKNKGKKGGSQIDDLGQYQLIEINTVPGMTDHSLVPMAAKQSGIDFEELVWRVLETSLE